MALTNAERQAAYKAKKGETIDQLTATNSALIAENAKLQLEVKTLTEKMHRMEINTLKAQNALLKKAT